MKDEKKDWLGKFFEDKFSEEQAPVDDQLWGQIEDRLKQKRRRRGVIWFWWGSGLIALLLLIGWHVSREEKPVLELLQTAPTNEEIEESYGQEESTATILPGKNQKEKAEIAPSAEERKEQTTQTLSKRVTNTTASAEKPAGSPVEPVFNTQLTNSKDKPDQPEMLKDPAGSLPTLEDTPVPTSSRETQKVEEGAVRLIFPISLLARIEPPVLTSRRKGLVMDSSVIWSGSETVPQQKSSVGKNPWYAGTSYILHRQLIYPNTGDDVFIRPVQDGPTPDTRQYGISAHIGKQVGLSPQLQVYGEALFGFQRLANAFERERLILDDATLQRISETAVRVNVPAEYLLDTREVNFVTAGIKSGLRWQPLGAIPIQLDLGLSWQYHFSDQEVLADNLSEVALEAGGQLFLGASRRWALQVQGAWGLSKGNWWLYESRRQSVGVGMRYFFAK